MGFQILNKDGEAIQIKQIDAEIAELFGVEVDVKWYASPPPYDDSLKAKFDRQNWFDKIGWMIHYDKLTTWDQILEKYLSAFQEIFDKLGYTTEEEKRNDLTENLHDAKYWFLLIDTFKEKGYIPKPVED